MDKDKFISNALTELANVSDALKLIMNIAGEQSTIYDVAETHYDNINSFIGYRPDEK